MTPTPDTAAPRGADLEHIEPLVRAVMMTTIPAYQDDQKWRDHWSWYTRHRGQGGAADHSTQAIGEQQVRAMLDALPRAPAAELPAQDARTADALAAAVEARAGEDGGWRLVPVEPTQEMVDAAVPTGRFIDVDELWHNMLAAAPKPPGATPTDAASPARVTDEEVEAALNAWFQPGKGEHWSVSMSGEYMSLCHGDMRAVLEGFLATRGPGR